MENESMEMPDPDLGDMEIEEVCPDCGEAIEDCECDLDDIEEE